MIKNLRPATYDKFIYDEVFVEWVYNKMSLNKKDIVLDIWANIWCYSVLAAKQAWYVVAFEPESINFKQLIKNTDNMWNVVKIKGAVASKDWEIDLYIYEGENKGLNHTVHTTSLHKKWRKASVKAFWIDKIIKSHKITKIKCDCEWWEYDIFENYTIPKSVKEIVWEGHLIDQDKKRAEKLMWSLQDQFKESTWEIWDIPTFTFYFKR
jgi:FkbM family methyltransferase